MTISSGLPIISSDIETLWSTSLANLSASSSRPMYNCETTFMWDGLNTSTSTSITEVSFTPPTDIYVKSIQFYIDDNSLASGTYTLTITGQMLTPTLTFGPLAAGSGYKTTTQTFSNRFILLAGNTIFLQPATTVVSSTRTLVRCVIMYDERLQLI